MDIVTVRMFGSRTMAEMAQGLLEEAGIESVIESDDAGGSFAPIWFTGGGSCLKVAAADRERAGTVLAVLSERFEEEEFPHIPPEPAGGDDGESQPG